MQRHLRTAFAAIDRIAARHAEFFEDVAPPTKSVMAGTRTRVMAVPGLDPGISPAAHDLLSPRTIP
jgi:hypothetical protein